MTPRSRPMIQVVAAITCLLAARPVATKADAQRARETNLERPATPATMGLQGYSVVLVIGNLQGAGSADTVPSAARKALTDMQAFLPYKRYQLLDAAWMLCCGAFRSPVSGRIRGPNDHEYSYSIDTLYKTDAKLTVRFSMRDETDVWISQAGGSGASGASGSGRGSGRGDSLSDTARLEHSRQLYEAIRERDEAELAVRTTKQKFDVGVMSAPEMEAATTRLRRAEQRAQDLQRLGGGGQAGGSGQAGGGARGAGSSGRNIMDSSFSIALGETVVIGTSRLNGDQALIAILTAAAKPGVSR
jgi:hypothetical protein